MNRSPPFAAARVFVSAVRRVVRIFVRSVRRLLPPLSFHPLYLSSFFPSVASLMITLDAFSHL